MPRKQNLAIRKKTKSSSDITPPILAFLSIETTIKFDCGLVVTTECEPPEKKKYPVYRVYLDQSKMAGKPTDSDHFFSLLAVGLQSTVEKGSGKKKSGTLRILEVYGENVEIGRRRKKTDFMDWEEVNPQSNDLKVNSIEPYIDRSTTVDEIHGAYLRSSGTFFGLRVCHPNCAWDGDPVWNRHFRPKLMRKLKSMSIIPPNGTNVPPPVPPGSSIN